MAITAGNVSTSGAKGAVISYTWNHTCNAGSNTCLVVTISGDTSVISSVKYNTVAMTQGAHLLSGTTYSDVWFLANPAVGTNAVLVTMNAAAGNSIAGAVDFFGVDQATPKDSSGTSTATSTSITVSTTIVNAGAFIVAGVIVPTSPVTFTLTGANSPVSIFNTDDGTNGQHCAGQYNSPAGTGATASTWTDNQSQFYVAAAMGVKPAAAAATTAPDYKPTYISSNFAGI